MEKELSIGDKDERKSQSIEVESVIKTDIFFKPGVSVEYLERNKEDNEDQIV